MYLNRTGNLELAKRAMDNAAEGIIITDANTPDNEIVFANQAFYDLTGYSPEEVIGKNCRFLQGADTNNERFAEMKRCIKERTTFKGELLNYKKNGEPFWNFLTIVPIFDENGELTHFTGSQNDITARKLAEDRANAAIKQLEAFSYTVSHDLQAPLRNIISFADLLQSRSASKLDEEAHEYLKFIVDGSKKMSALITDLLEFSKQKDARIKTERVDFDQMVNEIYAELTLIKGSRNIELNCSDLGTTYCDAALIRQVWANLIGNAIKYSSKKQKTEIELGKIEAGHSSIYYIKDNGAGFDNSIPDLVFRPFQRMHVSAEFEGTGIGLATVSSIIARHNGKIWAESEIGNGSTFYFTLPNQPG